MFIRIIVIVGLPSKLQSVFFYWCQHLLVVSSMYNSGVNVCRVYFLKIDYDYDNINVISNHII